MAFEGLCRLGIQLFQQIVPDHFFAKHRILMKLYFVRPIHLGSLRRFPDEAAFCSSHSLSALPELLVSWSHGNSFGTFPWPGIKLPETGHRRDPWYGRFPPYIFLPRRRRARFLDPVATTGS